MSKDLAARDLGSTSRRWDGLGAWGLGSGDEEIKQRERNRSNRRSQTGQHPNRTPSEHPNPH